MIELLGILFGGLGRLAQHWLDLRDKDKERQHELKMYDKQVELPDKKYAHDMDLRKADFEAADMSAEWAALQAAVQAQADEAKTAGGIVLPDTARNKPQRGKVLAVGDGRLLKDGSRKGLQVKVGDTVLFTVWAGDEFKDQKSDNILIMREEDVLAVIDD